jgi:hypothetical protein
MHALRVFAVASAGGMCSQPDNDKGQATEVHALTQDALWSEKSVVPMLGSFGSKCEILALSRCLPLFPQERTS